MPITQFNSDLTLREIPGIFRRMSILSRHLTAPPAAVEGDKYIPASVATGLWAGLENRIVEFHLYTGGTIAWISQRMPVGWVVFAVNEAAYLWWNGTIWQLAFSPGSGSLFSATFNATTDWTLSGEVFSRTITHSLNTQAIITQVWDETDALSMPVANILVDKTSVNAVRLRVSSDPDNRFAGRICIQRIA